MKSRPELLSGTCCCRINEFLDSGIEPPTVEFNLGPGWKLEPGTESRIESDRWDRTRIAGSGTDLDPGTGTNISESDRCDRTRCGSGNLTGTGPGLTAWLDPGT